MTVGFYLVDREHVSDGYTWAKGLIQSVRQSMPDVPVIHFTDESSKGVRTADDVYRLPDEPMARLRLHHQANVSGYWLFVDTDVIIQKSVTGIFNKAFDIAVTRRNWGHLKTARGFSTRMAYNTGVVFSKCQEFWGEAYLRSAQLKPELQEWMGDQHVICDLIQDIAVYENVTPYNVLELSGQRYNFPPACDSERDDFKRSEKFQEKASIIHYKGPERKAMLMARLKRERPCASV